MVIKIEEPTKEGYSPTLKFKDLHKAEYVIVSKDPQYDEPLTGPSQWAKNTGGNWYKFNLQLHEYQMLDDNADKKVEKFAPPKVVGYFDGDSEFEKNGQWIASKGTILKHLLATPANVKFKIRMEENDKGKKIYVIDAIDEVAEAVTPASATPKVDLPVKVAQLKKDGVPVEAMIPLLMKEYETSEDAIKVIYGGL